MTKRELKKKVNALNKELDKANEAYFKGKDFMEKAREKQVMLKKKIKEMDDQLALLKEL